MFVQFPATGEVPRTTDFGNGFPNHYSEVDGKMENDPLINVTLKSQTVYIMSFNEENLDSYLNTKFT